MSSSIYGRLALTNLRNNRKTYLPYLLTGALTVMMYYIMGAPLPQRKYPEGRSFEHLPGSWGGSHGAFLGDLPFLH